MARKPKWQLQDVQLKKKKQKKAAAKAQAKALKAAKLDYDPKLKKAKNGVPLSELRYPVPTPESLVDKKGRVAVGTFDKEFPIINLLDAKKVGVPKFLNGVKVTLWEALEVNFEDISFLTAMSVLGGAVTVALTLVYDKTTKEMTAFMSPVPAFKTAMSENLFDGSETFAKSKRNSMTFENWQNQGKARVYGAGKTRKNEVSYDLHLTRWSDPAVGSMPFGGNISLYSQKDIFTVEGSVIFNGKEYKANDATMAIIDDHRGYYPRKAHYDWVTNMGYCTVKGQPVKFGFNLTRNQSIDQDDYNENILWLGDKNDRLPPVYFKHYDYDHWRIYDDYGTIDLDYQVHDRNLVKFNLGVACSDYSITFGDLKGFIIGEDGTKYEIDDVGIGEDRSMKLL
ncbi:MAG: DUF2804 family protein [Clostridia bacterium]|nr:DUF2804 family protein [Clostridia bacterium]